MVPVVAKFWCAPVMPIDRDSNAPEIAIQVVDPVRVSETLVSIPSDGLNLPKGVLGNAWLSEPKMSMVKSSVIVFARAAIGVKAINPIITTARANLRISVTSSATLALLTLWKTWRCRQLFVGAGALFDSTLRRKSASAWRRRAIVIFSIFSARSPEAE
jgi:hypothetical protein